MGQQLPKTKNPPLKVQKKEMFQCRRVQRIKDTPFIGADLYSNKPLMFVDPLVNPRLGTKQLFPQEEVYSLMDSVVEGLGELADNGIAGHGDLCLESIYYSAKDKGFKLTHPAFNQQTGYLLTKHGKRFTTLSPEQLSALSEQSEADEVSIKSDIFCLGVILLEAGTLTPSSDIYCPDTYSIFHLQIQKRLQIIQEYYSVKVVQFIQMCLEYDPEVRAGIPELTNFISQMRTISKQIKK